MKDDVQRTSDVWVIRKGYYTLVLIVIDHDGGLGIDEVGV